MISPLIADLISRLGADDLPVLASSAEELAQQALRGERAAGADMADIVLRDPFFTLNVLRAIGTRKRSRLSSEITTIEHAVMMFGVRPFFERFAKPKVLEAQFNSNPHALLQLRRAFSRAHHAACQARDWAIFRQDMESEEVYIAASINDLAEPLLCLLAPETAAKLTEEIRRDPMGTMQAQQALLGFDLRALFDALAQAFKLPDLMRHLTDPGNMDQPRAQNVLLAASVARHAEFSWHGKSLEADVDAVAALLHLPADDAVSRIHRTAALAARAWRCYLAPPAARWLPLLPEAPPPQAPPSSFGSTQEVMAWAMRALQEEAGVTRVVFALRSPDGQTLRGKFSLGGEAESAFSQFQIGLSQPHLFAHLMAKQQGVWFSEQQANLRALVTDEITRVTGGGAFFAHSLFLGGKPFGLFYGDCRHRADDQLDAGRYHRFKEIVAKTAQVLNHLVGKKT